MLQIRLLTILTFYTVFLNAQSRFEYRYRQMGTQIRLVLYADDPPMAENAAKLVFGRIDELNDKLSDHVAESELNRLCARSGNKTSVSNDLYRVLQTSVEVSEQTGGSFDITAGPLIALWRNARQSKSAPLAKQITKAKKKVGYRYITFPEQNKVRLEKAGMVLDLGAIGKGYAADEVMKLLKSSGISSALIDVGGDIMVSDPPPDKLYWTLGFSYFNNDSTEFLQKIKLKNQAIATSGDKYQFVELDGSRYSHIVDPKSGNALKNGIQVTVIADNATLADAYASAYSVMGIAGTLVHNRKMSNLKVFMVENKDGENHQWMSQEFSDIILDH